MADEPKIVPDAPPWEPIDVDVVPDGPPWDPIDVPIYPDAPPWEAFQVATYPDGPPWQPHDVPTHPDVPPWEPVDVQIVPDGPPWVPTDVQNTPDGPPWTPTDVQLTPDGPSWAPVDVPTTPSPAPWDPVDVQVVPDKPGPLSGQLEVRDHRTPPEHVPWQPTSSGEIAGRLRRYDAKLADFLDEVGSWVPFVSKAGKGAFDPLVLAKWFENYRSSVGYNGVAKFIEEQQLLYAMNAGVARVFDPSYFVKLLIPGGTGMFNSHVDVGIDSQEEITRAKDNTIVGQLPFRQQENIRRGNNVYDYENRSTERQDFTVDEMVDKRTNGTVPLPHRYMTEDRETGVARFDASKYFESRNSFGAQKIRGTTKANLEAGQDVGISKLARSAATHGIVRLPVPTEGEPIPGGSVSYDGAVLSETTVPHLVDDDSVRLPLYFTDLRKDPASDAYRHVFFQPMNLVVAQSFSPQYNESQAFGRVDQNVAYVGTSRTWNVSFEQHAFAPEDLKVLYQKMNWLVSMVYPSYGYDALMRSGPVCRMRIGDLAASSEGGLPGVIRNLSFDWAECLWELKNGMKVPRSFSVQLDYTVLHDGPVGLLNGMFGVLSLPTGPSTNLAKDLPSEQSQGSQGDGRVGLATGHWARFGEPSRKG